MQDLLKFSDLPEYAFPRLRILLKDVSAPGHEVPLHIGEPTHNFPSFIKEKILENFNGFNSYPPNDGTPGLLSGIANWLSSRYKIPVPDFEKNIISLIQNWYQNYLTSTSHKREIIIKSYGLL